MILDEQHTVATDYDVSSDFNFIVLHLCIQAILMCLFCLYQLIGIYCFNSMLYYRFLVSRANKMVLIYGLVLFIQLNYYRYREAGKICSGDYLTDQEWHDDSINKDYLIYQGSVLQTYSRAVITAIIASVFMISYIVKQLLEIFS